jgi:hypothetical protein
MFVNLVTEKNDNEKDKMGDQLPRGAAPSPLSRDRHQYSETNKTVNSGVMQPPSGFGNQAQNRRPNTLPLPNQHDPPVGDYIAFQ